MAEKTFSLRPAAALHLGRRRYAPIHALQHELQAARTQGQIGDVVLLLEHEPVVTLGRSAHRENVLLGPDALAAMGVDLVETGRGGDVTLHAPGQLVGYPILDLRPDRQDLRRYVRGLAEVMIQLAREHDVEAGVVDGLVGVWADADRPGDWATAPWAGRLAKLGAIGVRVSRWVTMHGFAMNLDVDLEAFGVIVPCGISEHPVTSVAALTGRAPSVREAAHALRVPLARGLDLDVGEVVDLTKVEDDALLDAVRAHARPAPRREAGALEAP